MQEELDQIDKFQTFDTIKPPSNVNIIDGRWTLRRKRGANGEVIHHKARYVVQGFKQNYGVDYEETFAPTIRPATLRVILAIAAQRGAMIIQADVKNAYLHGTNEPNEIIYMKLPQHCLKFRELPPHLAHLDPFKLVCRLWRPLYDSKQGAVRFYQFMSETLVEKLWFKMSDADESLYHKFNDDGSFIILGASTDDFTIIGDSSAATDAFLDAIKLQVELARLGPISWLLCMSVEQDLNARTISLGPEASIDAIEKKFAQKHARPITTPLPPKIDLSHCLEHVSTTLATPAEDRKYREMIGSLVYLRTMTRPDIDYAVATLSQFPENPSKTHLDAARRVIRYLKATKHLRLVLGGKNESFAAYSYADYATTYIVIPSQILYSLLATDAFPGARKSDD